MWAWTPSDVSDICQPSPANFQSNLPFQETHTLVQTVWGNTLMHKIIRYDRRRGLAFFSSCQQSWVKQVQNRLLQCPNYEIQIEVFPLKLRGKLYCLRLAFRQMHTSLCKLDLTVFQWLFILKCHTTINIFLVDHFYSLVNRLLLLEKWDRCEIF